jgi:hypothetical protein
MLAGSVQPGWEVGWTDAWQWRTELQFSFHFLYEENIVYTQWNSHSWKKGNLYFQIISKVYVKIRINLLIINQSLIGVQFMPLNRMMYYSMGEGMVQVGRWVSREWQAIQPESQCLQLLQCRLLKNSICSHNPGPGPGPDPSLNWAYVLCCSDLWIG